MRTIDVDKAIEAVEKLKSEYRVPNIDRSGKQLHFHESIMILSEVLMVFDEIIDTLIGLEEVTQ